MSNQNFFLYECSQSALENKKLQNPSYHLFEINSFVIKYIREHETCVFKNCKPEAIITRKNSKLFSPGTDFAEGAVCYELRQKRVL